MTRRVLVLGAGGMLGHKVTQTLAGAAQLEVLAATRRPLPAEFFPASVRIITNVDLSTGSVPLRSLLEQLRPDVIVNAVGAIKQKDLAGAVDETLYLNAMLPHALALLNPNPNGRVIHVSTDCVFTGTRGGYQEHDPPDAEDLYGRSKAVGEIANGRHLTFRTSIVGFELSGHLGLLSWFLKQPRGSTLRGFTQATFSGLPTVMLARAILDAITRHESLAGLYHVASQPISKFDLLARLNEALDLGYHLVPDDTLRIDRSLDDTRYREATGTVRPQWGALVEALAVDYRAWPYAPIYDALKRGSSTDADSR